MLVRTTSCDDGVQFDLTCDGCGEVQQAGPALRRNAEALLGWASELGWALTSATHCGNCGVPSARSVGAVLGTGDGR